MELQYEIEALEEVERCFVHIDYETRDYDEHVISKVPELREALRGLRNRRGGGTAGAQARAEAGAEAGAETATAARAIKQQ